MKSRLLRLGRVVVLVMTVTTASGVAEGQPPLKAGDRAVFLGDSITQQRIFTRYVMNYFTLREIQGRGPRDTAVGNLA